MDGPGREEARAGAECGCGSVYMNDAVFCRHCGTRRPGAPAPVAEREAGGGPAPREAAADMRAAEPAARPSEWEAYGRSVGLTARVGATQPADATRAPAPASPEAALVHMEDAAAAVMAARKLKEGAAWLSWAVEADAPARSQIEGGAGQPPAAAATSPEGRGEGRGERAEE